MRGEDGYELWLRYRRVDDADHLAQYRETIRSAAVLGTGATAAIIRSELGRALPVLLDNSVPISREPSGSALVVGTADELAAVGVTLAQAERRRLGEEGFLIRHHQTESNNWLLIGGNSGPAVLTGIFHFLRLLQTHQNIHALDLMSRPRIRHRILAHWDNLDGSIERGYAGRSLWNWDELPRRIDPRYHDYARACASIGINGACLNNVNASARSLTAEYLEKAAALADVFRPYGMRVYLSPVFSAPMVLGGLSTSDPRDPAVAAWWRRKADEIYRLIPDFGGFQVKANSEGQPGPQDYGANHADGANMLADALAPHGGMVLWRAFVYDTTVDADRAKCAYKEFVPLDGRFRPNVFVQVKNGPVDFQPREPFHPLFGAMKGTPLALELQITQEYLGQSVHLVYLGPMWEEILGSDTCADGAVPHAPRVAAEHDSGPRMGADGRGFSSLSALIRNDPRPVLGAGSTVAEVVDGSLNEHATSCIIGVANTGSDRNWCGHHFAQANWYAFGRLAWDDSLSAQTIADEWTRMTWSSDPSVVDAIETMMLGSWESCINTMTPLGLHHLMQEGHHYGPDPGFQAAKRVDWNNVYFHRADKRGIGFDRSSTGSNAVSQYHRPLREQFDEIEICPEKFLLWFHHVPWDHRLPSGSTLWGELQHRYDAGVAFVERMRDIWQDVQAGIDPQRHAHVSRRLEQQLDNARLWRQVCIHYFSQFR
ncbi:MAG: alpha-glucuronidase family glycosyl hydrolase [Chloroflexi bacterium]|nr:alpha-glucuronidase family glycosyl hydrolase [Chloroflexota bacterium]